MIPPPVALLVWPLIAIALVYRLGPTIGVTVALLAGLLALPEGYGFNLPMLPPITKYEIVSLSAMIGFAAAYPRRLAEARPGRGVDLLLVAMMASAFGTAYANRDALPLGGQPLTLYDGLSMAIRDLLFLGFPFMLGRAAHRSAADLQNLLRAWFVTMLAASIFVVAEIRLTPFLHELVYGYRARALAQEFRWGGARPMLMMPNGLALSMLVCLGVVCTAALAGVRAKRFRAMQLGSAAYLTVVLVLSRSLASAVYGVAGTAAAVLLRPRRQLLVALLLGSLGLVYPVARSLGVMTGRSVVELAGRLSPERARSFEFRLVNEDAMIDFAKRRPLLGYGVFGNRNRFFNEATRRRVITDGYWTILLTGRGAVGLVVTFGILELALLRAWRRASRFPVAAERAAAAGVALILALQIVDLLPNGLFSFMPFYVAGALWGGCAQGSPGSKPPPTTPATPEPPPSATPRRSFASLAGRRGRSR